MLGLLPSQMLLSMLTDDLAVFTRTPTLLDGRGVAYKPGGTAWPTAVAAVRCRWRSPMSRSSSSAASPDATGPGNVRRLLRRRAANRADVVSNDGAVVAAAAV